jgi:HK97 family phage major capsid protein
MELNEIKDALEGIKGQVSEAKNANVNEIKSSIEALEGKMKEANENTVKAVKDELNNELKGIQEHLDKLDVKMQSKSNGIVNKSIVDELKENKDTLLSIAKRNTNAEVELKASVIRASVTGNQQALELSDIGQLATRKLSMYDAFAKFPVGDSNHNGTIRYYDWDEATIARASAMVAEGAAFPESTAKWVTNVIDLKKIGDSLPVSEEFLEDEQMFAAELGQFLVTNVNLTIDSQIANGDGTGTNLKGLVASVDAYTPVVSGISDASIYDLIPKVCESITTTGGAKYEPNVAFMNKADINKYKLKKDANNNYVMPPFVSREGDVIDGVTVIEANVIAANSMVIGDRRFARIYEKSGLAISQGEVNAQFTSDMKTLKVRKRLLFLIRGADKGGWKKVTSISAALVTLAT